LDDRRFNRDFRKKESNKQRKTEYEKRKTHEEVQKIKQNLISFASSNWGKRWITTLLERGRPFRMQRGIQYAEDDERFANLTINKGIIFATVQGTAPLPYRVRISLELIPENGWKEIIKDLKKRVLNFIQLLDGQLPEDIINIFKVHDYPLFPDIISENNANCSCPDKAVPCKHIASVILYLARVLDYNPFLLLELRGKSKNELLNALSLEQQTEVTEEKVRISEKVERLSDTSVRFNVPSIFVNDISPKEVKNFESEPIGFNIKKPLKTIPTLENLGLPTNLDNPKAFKAVLKGIYRTVTSECYKKSLMLKTNE
jgi:uncharacterized Zn finger protein